MRPLVYYCLAALTLADVALVLEDLAVVAAWWGAGDEVHVCSAHVLPYSCGTLSAFSMEPSLEVCTLCTLPRILI